MKSSSLKSSPWILTSRSILILTVRYFRSNMCLKPLFHLTICLLSMRWNSFVHLFFLFLNGWKDFTQAVSDCVTCRPLAASFTVSNWWWPPLDTWTWLCLRSLSLQWILAAAAMPGFFLSREPPVTPWAMRRLKRCVSSWTAPWQVQTNSGRPIIKAWKHAGETTNPWFTDW